MKNSLCATTLKLYLMVFVLLLSSAQTTFSQDIGILSSTSPNSGCELSNSELVTVVIFNFGLSYSGSFDVSYEINGGAPVTESITLSPFPTLSSFSYTFTASADLSTANTYNFDFYTDLPGDVNTTNDTLTGITVISDTTSIGGIVASSISVCDGINSGTLNLNSFIGSIQYWESSTTAGASWTNIPNTTNSENYLNITQETWYRAVVLNGFCPQDTSTIAVLSIDPLTVPGTITGATTLCAPPNNGSLTLSGHTGTITDWEFSSNGGTVWNSIGSTANPYNYVNQPVTYLYRAVVQSGACSSEFSDTVLVSVLAGAIGGTLAPANTTECSGSNSGTITLSGQSGTISGWEMSINSGGVWSPIANTTTTHAYLNLTTETWYRALLSDCNQDTSAIAVVAVDPNPVGGILSSDATVCANSNSGTITLAGETGTIVDWESSINGGSTWTSIGNVTNGNNYTNLTTTTLYRVLISGGVCGQVFSDTVTITVVTGSDAGTITGPANVCISGNSGSLVTTGVQGTIIDWEFSINGGATWTSLGNTTTSQAFLNLAQTTLYQIVAINGTCPLDTSQFLVTVDNPTVAGTLFADATVCYNSSGFIYVNGHVGNVFSWEASTDNGASWNPLGFFVDTIGYTNIATQTKYRTLIKNGGCSTDTTNTITVDLFPFNFGTSNDTIIELGNSATISAFGGLFYSWTPTASLSDPTSNVTVATPLITTNYVVSIVDGNGCVYQDNVTVEITVSSSEVIIADLITANGDGYNDVWNIIGIENHPDTKVLVFNTTGNVVYESANYDNSWQGTYNGNQLPDGTYYYIVELVNGSDIKKGYLTIVSE